MLGGLRDLVSLLFSSRLGFLIMGLTTIGVIELMGIVGRLTKAKGHRSGSLGLVAWSIAFPRANMQLKKPAPVRFLSVGTLETPVSYSRTPRTLHNNPYNTSLYDPLYNPL